MDRFLIRKVKLDASTVPANIQEEETSEKGNGEEKSARENPEGEPVSEAGPSTEQQDKLTNAEQMKTRKQGQVNVFQKLPSVKGANRKLVRCSVCYRNISFFSFHFYIFLEGYPSALLVFKGPPLKEKQYIYIQLKYSDYNTTKKTKKVSQKLYLYLTRKNKWCYASMAFSFILKVRKV